MPLTINGREKDTIGRGVALLGMGIRWVEWSCSYEGRSGRSWQRLVPMGCIKVLRAWFYIFGVNTCNFLHIFVK